MLANCPQCKGVWCLPIADKHIFHDCIFNVETSTIQITDIHTSHYVPCLADAAGAYNPNWPLFMDISYQQTYLTVTPLSTQILMINRKSWGSCPVIRPARWGGQCVITDQCRDMDTDHRTQAETARRHRNTYTIHHNVCTPVTGEGLGTSKYMDII